MTTDLVSVPVPGAAVPMQASLVDGEPFVALKPMCEAIGIDADTQRRKLDQAEWARTVTMTAHDSSGRVQRMVGVHADSIPMWLATIDTGRIAVPARPVLIAYQREAVRALRDYFYRGVAVQSGVNQLDVIQAMLDQARANEQRLSAHEVVMDDHTNRLKALECETGWSTTLGYCIRHGIPMPPRFVNRLGKRAARIGRARGITVKKVADLRYGEVNAWPEEVLAAAVAELAAEGVA